MVWKLLLFVILQHATASDMTSTLVVITAMIESWGQGGSVILKLASGIRELLDNILHRQHLHESHFGTKIDADQNGAWPHG